MVLGGGFLSVLFLLQRLPHFHDAGLLDEVGQVEGGLLDTSLALPINENKIRDIYFLHE